MLRVMVSITDDWAFGIFGGHIGAPDDDLVELGADGWRRRPASCTPGGCPVRQRGPKAADLPELPPEPFRDWWKKNRA